MQTTDEHDLTLAEVLRKAMELTVNEDGERMFDNIPEEEDLAMLDPARPVPEADGVAEADATTVYADANDVDVDVEIDDDDLELLDRFEDFDDEALEGAMKRQAAEGRREGNREEEQGKQRAFAGMKKGFLGPSKRPSQPAQPTPPAQPAKPAQPPVVGDVRERTSSAAPTTTTTTFPTPSEKRKPLSKFKQQQLMS